MSSPAILFPETPTSTPAPLSQLEQARSAVTIALEKNSAALQELADLENEAKAIEKQLATGINQTTGARLTAEEITAMLARRPALKVLWGHRKQHYDKRGTRDLELAQFNLKQLEEKLATARYQKRAAEAELAILNTPPKPQGTRGYDPRGMAIQQYFMDRGHLASTDDAGFERLITDRRANMEMRLRHAELDIKNITGTTGE